MQRRGIDRFQEKDLIRLCCHRIDLLCALLSGAAKRQFNLTGDDPQRREEIDYCDAFSRLVSYFESMNQLLRGIDPVFDEGLDRYIRCQKLVVAERRRRMGHVN
jgi:hypothetical protein